ncbi:MAG: VIT domain-containing protein [Elusimicrobiota bacterium]|nr:VIT domain-containing protein [Elusimicrobiota bacterium]
MKRAMLSAVLTLGFSVPAAAQQLLAWPVEAAQTLRMFLPGRPLPMPLPPGPRPVPPGPRPVPPGPRPSPVPAPVLPPEAAPIALSGYRVEGTVTDQVAELTFRITFHNPTDRRLEGVLMVPLPADAVLSGFSMTMGGKDVKGELLEAAQAASIYQAIVSRAIDPGLLELVGERMFRARVFPIEPRGDVVATLKLTQTLPKSGGLASLRVPFSSARFLQAERGKASARIALKTTRPLRTVFSPTEGASVAREGERGAVLTFEEGAAGLSDLSLLFSMREDPLAAGLLAFREPGEDGTFMLTLSPKVEDDAAKAAPKDVVFVVDRSGSMQEGGKMDQARKALQYCVSRLNAQDRFGIVDFATDWSALHDALLPAGEAEKARAKRYVERLEAAGGTNIEAGLTEGLKLLARSEGRVPMVFFLTDGVPTVGQTDVGALLKKAAESNASLRARLFSFGVGSDVNTLLLDKLAEGGRGARDYVAPGEDIEVKVGSLYQKVAKPVLTDVKVEWEGLEVADALPRPVPDLFSGAELTLYGRYKTAGRGSLVVTGRAGGRPARFVFPVELPKEETRHPFVPRLWATQKIARELDLIRLSGRPADPEVVASIVKLAKKHGIVTPYTSYLVTEEGTDLARMTEESRRRMDEMSRDAAFSGFGGSGRRAQADSMMFARLGAAAPASAPAVAALRGAAAKGKDASLAFLSDKNAALREMDLAAREESRKEGRSLVETRSVGGKTFYRRGSAWVDGDAEGAARAPVTKVATRSTEYFALLAAHPALAKFLALGDEVKVLWDGVVYAVAP